ncbi:MAG: 3-deoxy-7-phosphoheptulonate synthase [Candidatus Oxydemutatoraceae bacterium WSBS_2016_MAG_OTU14]
MLYPTDDLRIRGMEEVIFPAQLIKKLPMTEKASATVHHSRQQVSDIIHRKDKRLIVIVGPCSIHNIDSALEYADLLQPTMKALDKTLHIIMRVYFEKPRTTVGWKGLINDPYLDDSFKINHGLEVARSLLLKLNEKGISTGTEYLDPISPQYISDLVSWGAIGARTTESQVHRELASGLSCPVGFKNGTHGNLQIAVDAMRSSSHPHHFMSVTKNGCSAIFSTTGNPDCHIIMRGGGGKSNYDAESIHTVCGMLEKAKQEPRVMIDFSHANSSKQFERQKEVCADVSKQIADGDERIIGVMIESNLVEGRQDLKEGVALTYGQSITDACLAWDDTKELLHQLSDAVERGLL